MVNVSIYIPYMDPTGLHTVSQKLGQWLGFLSKVELRTKLLHKNVYSVPSTANTCGFLRPWRRCAWSWRCWAVQLCLRWQRSMAGEWETNLWQVSKCKMMLYHVETATSEYGLVLNFRPLTDWFPAVWIIRFLVSFKSDEVGFFTWRPWIFLSGGKCIFGA